MPDEPVVRDEVDEAVAAAGCGDVRRRFRPDAGQRNEIWVVDSSAGGPLVVRFLADDARFEMELAMLSRAADAGVPVAEVLWAAPTPRAVMVQRQLRGELLADVEPSDDLCRSVAETLRSIHAIPIAGGYGNLRPDLRGEDERLSRWFTGRVRDEVVGVTLTPEDARLVDGTLAAFDAAEPLLDRQPSGLAHGDVQPYNLLVEGERVIGVVDWEAAKAGPPAFDLGWWDWFSTAWSTPWSTDAMLDHYDPDRRLDREELGEMRRLVVMRVWLRELLAATHAPDEHRALLARRGLEAARR